MSENIYIENLSKKRSSVDPIERGHEKVAQDPIGLFLEQIGQDSELGKLTPSNTDLSYLSPEQRAESLWATFQSVKGLISGRKRKNQELSTTEKKKLELGLSILKKLYKDQDTQEVYLRANQEHFQEIESINGDYEKYKVLDRQIKEAQAAYDASARNLFTKRGEGADEVDILMFETNGLQLKEARRQLAELVNQNPELGALIEYQTIREYSDQLRRENFIWSPSRRKLLEEIELAALSGKPVLLSGESGTGKTRLVEQASLTLTGRINNETAGKDVRFQDLIAKPKISTDGATYYEYKEIGEAVTGKDTSLESNPQHEGRIVADDEFNLLPTAEQTERLARIATWTPGKRIRMPVTNEEVTVAPDFLYCAMVNLASERYDRKKIPPEVLRKFAKADVDYPEQAEDNPEIYEMMLAALMDEGSRLEDPVSARIDIKSKELNPTGFERDEMVEKIESDFGGLDIYFSFDLSGSMSQPDGATGRIKADVQRDVALLFVDSLTQLSYMTRQYGEQSDLLPIKIMVTLASDTGDVKLPLTDKWGPKEQWAFYSALTQLARGGTPTHRTLEKIEVDFDKELAELRRKNISQDKLPIQYTAEISDGAPDDFTETENMHQKLKAKGMAIRSYTIGGQSSSADASESLETFSQLPQILAKDIITQFRKLRPRKIKP